jgi:hypothetical protein
MKYGNNSVLEGEGERNGRLEPFEPTRTEFAASRFQFHLGPLLLNDPHYSLAGIIIKNSPNVQDAVDFESLDVFRKIILYATFRAYVNTHSTNRKL